MPVPRNGTRRAGDEYPGEEIIDLFAVRADDELIDALAACASALPVHQVGSGAEDRVSALLAAWKAEVDEDPFPSLVDVDAAVGVIRVGRTGRGRSRYLVPVAVAGAALVALLGGLSIGSYSAQPDDVLWPVSKVLYAERAESVVAAERAEDRIATAKRAIADGDPQTAERVLTAAATDLDGVRAEEGHGELAEVQDFLAAKAEETAPGESSDPGSPLRADPPRKVPLGAEMFATSVRASESTSSSEPSNDGSSSAPTTTVSDASSEQPVVVPASGDVVPTSTGASTVPAAQAGVPATSSGGDDSVVPGTSAPAGTSTIIETTTAPPPSG